MIAIDLSKHYVHDADPKAIQQINFTVANNSVMFFITEEAKETILDSWGIVKVLWIYSTLNNTLNEKLSN